MRMRGCEELGDRRKATGVRRAKCTQRFRDRTSAYAMSVGRQNVGCAISHQALCSARYALRVERCALRVVHCALSVTQKRAITCATALLVMVLL